MELQHLSRIVSLYPNTALSRFACFKIRKSLLEQGLANDEEIVYSLLICRKCSQKLMPGINCEVAVEGQKKKFVNCAVYKCGFCAGKTRFGGVEKGMSKYRGRKVKGEEKKMSEGEEKKLSEVYGRTEMRSLSKESKKKSLIECFFESTQESSLYKIFH